MYCPNLDILHIYCCSEKEDIRRYLAHLIHDQLKSLTFIFLLKCYKFFDEQLLTRRADMRNGQETLAELHFARSIFCFRDPARVSQIC